ncbi:MAG: type IV pilus modification PilV family protein [Methylococcales bacterium]
MSASFPRECRILERGFSLLEILVAFSIMAVILGVLLQIFGKGLNMADTGQRYSRAVLIAESLLATVGQTRKIEVGEESGEIGDFYDWSIQIQPYEDPDLDAEGSLTQYFLYGVSVSVRWENRSVVLRTLRFGPPV